MTGFCDHSDETMGLTNAASSLISMLSTLHLEFNFLCLQGQIYAETTHLTFCNAVGSRDRLTLRHYIQ
jgi:hypothetical protein